MRIPAIPGIAFVQDDDCHWYFCPASKADEAEAHNEAVSEFWQNPPEDINVAAPDDPDWLIPVGGAPSLIKTTDAKVKEMQSKYGI